MGYVELLQPSAAMSDVEPESPKQGSPVKAPYPTPGAPPPTKKQLSSAQKASLARAREKARLSKIAKSQAKADQEKQFAKFQESVVKPPSPAKEAAATAMSESESEPSPSPVKKKKVKRAPKKKRRYYTSSDSDTSEDDLADAKLIMLP